MASHDESSSDIWDPSRYRTSFGYVPELGKKLIDLLAPGPGLRVIDLGCGTGELTALIAERGAYVVGVDASEGMIAAARGRFPSVPFRVARAEEYHPESPADAVFSNMAMHWVKTPRPLLERIFHWLKPGGRLVVQVGCAGNHEKLNAAVAEACRSLGIPFDPPWQYLRLGEYAGLLDQCGYDVERAELDAQTTTLEDGERGARGWIEMYLPALLQSAGDKRERLLSEAEARLRPTNFSHGNWKLEFRRMRLVARRPV